MKLTVGELKQLINEAWFSKKEPKESLVDKLASYADVSKDDAQSTLDDFMARGIDPNDLIIDDEAGFDKLAAAATRVPETKAKRAAEAKKQAWIKEYARLEGLEVADVMAALGDYTNLQNSVSDVIVRGITPSEWTRRYDDAMSLTDAARRHKKKRVAPSAQLGEVIRKQGDKWVLYTKHKKGGKRRKLGTHSSKASAERQEKAIHSHGG